jgi:hypothetical protein
MKYSEPRIDEKLKEFLHKLNSLDFGPLAYKLMNPEDRPGLSLEQAIDAIKKYKGFLFIYYANRGNTISPSRYIDYVWHTHILDTELYFVQTAILFGHYLHHFPFFGKRDAADERDLLVAANFTKGQALSYFGWDDDDWFCGNGPKPKWPKPNTSLADLVNVIFPAGVNVSGINQNPDTITIQAGNFRHTVEHFGSQTDTLFSLNSSRLDYLEQIIKKPIWVIVCKPVDNDILNQAVVIHQGEKLLEISNNLVEKRVTPEGFSGSMVNLLVGS